MKPIINVEFTEEIGDIDTANRYFQNVKEVLKDSDYYLIGTFKPFMEIKEIFGESVILKFNAKDYTVNEIIEALEKYEQGKEINKCQI